MAKTKLTQRTVLALQPGPKDAFLWDTELTGFGVKVTPRARKVMVLQYRMGGGRDAKTQRITIGTIGKITVDHARSMAKAALADIAEGRDPAAQRREQQEATANTVEVVAKLYLDRRARDRNLRESTLTEEARLMHKEVLPHLGDKPIASVRRRDMLELRDNLSDKGHVVTANKVVDIIKRMLSFAVEREYVDRSPIEKLPSLPEQARQRTLDDAELAAIWEAAPRSGRPWGPWVQILMLTAARRDEVAGMQWDELSDDMTVWTLPDERTKTSAGRTILLPAAATEILRGIPRYANVPWVFTVTKRAPICGYGAAKERLDRDSGITGWTFHDFRRSFSTWLARMDFEPHIAEAALGHLPVKGIAAVYNTHRYAEPCRLALEAWSAHVSGTEPAANVVTLRRAEGT